MNTRRDIRTRLGTTAAAAAALVLAGQSVAHNNAVIHPEITLRATELLVSEFPDEYDEVTEYEGVLRPATRLHNVTITSDNDLVNFEDHADYDNGPLDNIVSGAVEEDVPVSRVLGHFYHARTGIGLALNRNSASKAREFFHQSIAMYGDSEQSKQQAYFFLGRATHHVEDMSSPAHVHNDEHLTFDPAETEDYEARWLPLEVWNNQLTNFHNYLNQATSVPEIDQWKDVWGADAGPDAPGDVGDLAGFIFDRASYLGTLEFPDDDPAVAPTGELQEMFPCDNVDRPRNCLRHEYDIPFVSYQWSIDSVGDFNYQAVFDGTFNEWWPIAANDENPGTNLPNGVQGEYYLEQAIPEGEVWEFDSAVVPNRVRGNFNALWNPATNPTVANPDNLANSIVDRRARNLLAPSAAYAAGFIKWWADIVNPPPILRKIKVSQGGEVKYSAEWVDDDDEPLPEIVIDEIWPETHTNVVITDVPSRQLMRGTDLGHISDSQDLELRLDFSEQVDPFSIEVNINIELAVFNLLSNGTNDNYSLLDLQADCPDQEVNRCWQIGIPKENLQAIPVELNGKRRLIIRANDTDRHWKDVGKELDGNPATPARRQTPAAEVTNLTYDFPWHDEFTYGRDTTTPPGSDQKLGSNVYEHIEGDRSHVLLFDTQQPTVNEVEVEF